MSDSRIVIIGGGLVGQTLAQKLCPDGYDVTIVERDPDLAAELLDTLDVQVVEGDGSMAPMLRQAGVDKASLVVACTDSDECNVVVGLLSAQLFRVPRVLVRLRQPGHEEGLALLAQEHTTDLVSVNPDTAAVERVAQLLEVPGALDVATFMDGALMIVGFRIRPSSELAGLRVFDMRLLFGPTPTLAVAIQRGTSWSVPHGEEVIQASDLVYFAVPRALLEDLLGLVGVSQDRRNRVMIAGASPLGLALAKRLRGIQMRVTMIEENRDRANRAAAVLEGVVVIHGRPTDHAQLEDEEIERCGAFVSVTPDHETNLVAGILAKRLGVGRSLALVDNPALVPLVGEIGIDAIISQRLLTIGLTLQHIRGAGVRSGAALLGEAVEIMEVDAAGGSALTSAPLRDVKLPRGVLVAALKRGDELLVPHGEDRVLPGDSVVIITTAELARRVTEFLQP